MIHLTSFVIGIGVAWAFPLLSRALRPLLVEATVAGMSAFEEGRRIVAEQIEVIEDIAAEAKARREEVVVDEDDETTSEPPVEIESRERGRRRNGAARRRAS